MRWYLLCYDVRCPKRLKRLHYRLVKLAVFLQRSVAIAQLAPQARDELWCYAKKLTRAEDDLRMFPLYGLSEIWLHGAHPPLAARALAGRLPTQSARL